MITSIVRKNSTLSQKSILQLPAKATFEYSPIIYTHYNYNRMISTLHIEIDFLIDSSTTLKALKMTLGTK